MDKYIQQAFSDSRPISRRTFKTIKKLGGGKSGAGVYELSCDRILKIYDARKHYKRNITDIVMTCLLPDDISPHVYDYGFLEGGKPYMVMEKVNGIELFHYVPNGTVMDAKVLLALNTALHTFNETIEQHYRSMHAGHFVACHRDLHPHNIFVDMYTSPISVKLIDFDMALCPYDSLRESNGVSRKSGLFTKFVKNNIAATNKYVHYENVMQKMPKMVKSDADLYQIYSIYIYYCHNNKELHPLLDIKATNKRDFIGQSIQLLTPLAQDKKIKF